MKPEESQAAIDTRTNAQFYMDKLQHEIKMLTNGGVIECAVRNPDVAECIAHLEGRIAAAESRESALREALKNAISGMNLAYEAASKNLTDEALLHLGVHMARADAALNGD